MANESLGDKLEKSYEQIKGGLKNIAQKATEEDTEPRIGLIPGRAGGASPVSRTRSTAKTAGMTKEQLYADAKRLNVKGRSKMTKAELAKAVRGR